jgi:hypothetical protein
LDFGVFPGSSHASVAVTGQTAILSGSLVEAWIFPAATADHTADEHLVETLKVMAYDITPGAGFVIHGLNTSELFEPPPVLGLLGRSASGLANGRGRQDNQVQSDALGGGEGTTIYGKWNIAWVWT